MTERQGEVICCFGCGRDTRAEGGYCYHCIGRGIQIDDRKDRPVIHFDGDPICQQSEPHEDDYREDSMGPEKLYPYFDKGENNRHFDRMAKIYNQEII